MEIDDFLKEFNQKIEQRTAAKKRQLAANEEQSAKFVEQVESIKDELPRYKVLNRHSVEVKVATDNDTHLGVSVHGPKGKGTVDLKLVDYPSFVRIETSIRREAVGDESFPDVIYKADNWDAQMFHEALQKIIYQVTPFPTT